MEEVTLHRLKDTYDPPMDFHRWGTFFCDWELASRGGGQYKPFVDFQSVLVSDTELIGLKRKISVLVRPLAKRLNALPIAGNFFRMSTRSPKDVWMKVAPCHGVNEGDDRELVLAKLQRQLELCRVNSPREVLRLIALSDRIQEDIDIHVAQSRRHHCMAIILMQWRDIPLDQEVRLFIKGRKLVACCPYLTLSQENTCNMCELTQFMAFVSEAMSRLPPTYQDVVMDVYTDKIGDVHLIELNPYDDSTDPISFTWEYLNSLSHHSSDHGGQ